MNRHPAFDAPEWVRQSATLLRDATDQYLFISTRAVYLDYSRVPMTADAPVTHAGKTLPWPLTACRTVTPKRTPKREAQSILPGRVTVVRPGIIMGPGDDTNRFTYWPVRVARGGEMIAPGDGSDHVQLIDVRDLVEFNIKLVEDRNFGVFNAVGPQMGQPFKEFLERRAAWRRRQRAVRLDRRRVPAQQEGWISGILRSFK